jgi:hypothetical protein
MNLNSPIFHFLRCQLEVFRGNREGMMGGAVLFQGIFLDRRRSLKEDDHAVSRPEVSPVKMISHVIPVELRDLHSQDLGVEFYRAFHVIDGDTNMVNSGRGDHNFSFVNAFGALEHCSMPITTGRFYESTACFLDYGYLDTPWGFQYSSAKAILSAGTL